MKMRTCGYTKCAPCRMKDYELREMRFVCDYLKRVHAVEPLCNVFIDVGAHVGLWSLHMNQFYQDAFGTKPIVYALEADYSNYLVLQLNADQFKTRIVPIHAAAWDSDKGVYLKHHDNPSQHQVFSHGLTTPVPSMALDQLVCHDNRFLVDAIKIDIEGAELWALKGAQRILADNKQLLCVVEYSVEHFKQYKYTCQDVTDFMLGCGFKPVRSEDRQVVANIAAGAIKRVMFVKGDIA